MPIKGYKTSEFYVVLGTAIAAVVNASGVLPFVVPTDIVISIFGMVGAYVISRGVAKAGK